MNLTYEERKTLGKLGMDFVFAQVENAKNPDVDTFKFEFDLETCALLEKIIYEVLKYDEV